MEKWVSLWRYTACALALGVLWPKEPRLRVYPRTCSGNAGVGKACRVVVLVTINISLYILSDRGGKSGGYSVLVGQFILFTFKIG